MLSDVFLPSSRTKSELSDIAQESQLSQKSEFTWDTRQVSSRSNHTNKDSVIKMLRAQVQFLREQLTVLESQRGREIHEIKGTMERLGAVLMREVELNKGAQTQINKLSDQNSALKALILSSQKCSRSKMPTRQHNLWGVPRSGARASLTLLAYSQSPIGPGDEHCKLKGQVSEIGESKTILKEPTILNTVVERRSSIIENKLQRLDREISLSKQKLSRRNHQRCPTIQ